MADKFTENLEMYGFDPKFLFGVNIRAVNDDDLKAMAESTGAFKGLQAMFSKYKSQAYKDLMLRQVQANVNDTSDRIKLAQDIVTHRVFYTLANADKIAKAEIKRRREARKRKDS